MAALVVCAGMARGADAPLPMASARDDGFAAERLARVHDYLHDATGADGYIGAVALVARHGRIVDWQAYGYRDLARREPLRRDAIFRIYSMTKTVTTVAVLMLMEDGKLSLDDPLSRYLPGFEHPQIMAGGDPHPASGPITLHALLTHTAGYPAGLRGDEPAVKRMEQIDPHGAKDLRGFAERMSRVPLAAEPDTRFGYDGASLELAARVVEVVSGEPFERFLQQRIFAPLAMHDTGFAVPEAKRARVVDITTMGKDGQLRIADGPSAAHPGAMLNEYPSGAGGLYSTASDYARFAQMLLDGGTLDGQRVLGRKTVELMLRNHLTMLDPPVNQFNAGEGFGLGGYVVLDPARRGQPGSVGQFGWSGAASTYYMIDPRQDLLAILLLQHLPREDGGKDLPRLSRGFYARVYQALRP
jgi:CubicO group peptidase (beta-lactamase class C family)